MEQFRQIAEVIGSLKGLMVFRDEIRINNRQCCLLVDAFNLAFDTISEEMRSHLRFDERLTKWKDLEQPLRELHLIFRDGEQYVRQCMDTGDWWGKALALNQTQDCVELHLHDLLWCIPVVLEVIENVGEISGHDQEDIYKKRLVFSKKYEKEWMDPKLFQHELGKLYLVTQEFCSRLDTAWKEDRWILSEMISEKRSSGLKPLKKQENRLADLLVGQRGKHYPSSVLLGTPDYQVRRQFGPGNIYKEVEWMGESFAVKHVIGEMEPVMKEISLLSSVTHPNVMHYMYSFINEEKKECFIAMDLMNKDLSSYIEEVSSPRKKMPFSLTVAVDTMLQIARGMEYLHSKKIHHGDLNPSNILVKSRNSSSDSYLHVKVAGFGIPPVKKNAKASANQVAAEDPSIWYAPEVLSEQEQFGNGITNFKFSEKADVYSFSMICFELLTGKVPFEDDHLQGDKMSKNIRAGERPLFTSESPKFLANLTKKCWNADPVQRPTFSSICKVLRYFKRFLIMNPDHSQPDLLLPPVDYFDIEVMLSRRFTSWANKDVVRVSDIPFEMYAYRVLDREKSSANVKDKSSESVGEEASLCGDETALNTSLADEMQPNSPRPVKPSPQINLETNKKASPRKLHLREASPKKALPGEASPKKALPGEASPKKALPGEASPKKGLPREASPKKGLPREASPRKNFSRDPSPSPRKVFSRDPSPKKSNGKARLSVSSGQNQKERTLRLPAIVMSLTRTRRTSGNTSD